LKNTYPNEIGTCNDFVKRIEQIHPNTWLRLITNYIPSILTFPISATC